jgi:hypothetical protein
MVIPMTTPTVEVAGAGRKVDDFHKLKRRQANAQTTFLQGRENDRQGFVNAGTIIMQQHNDSGLQFWQQAIQNFSRLQGHAIKPACTPSEQR